MKNCKIWGFFSSNNEFFNFIDIWKCSIPPKLKTNSISKLKIHWATNFFTPQETQSKNLIATVGSSKKLKRRWPVYCLLSGVGDEVNQKELEMLASSYDHVYLLKNVNALSQIQDKLAARFCRGKGYLWSSGHNPDSCHYRTRLHFSEKEAWTHYGDKLTKLYPLHTLLFN